MKLQTSIKPRRNGSVVLTGLDGVAYKFEPDENGDMVCDVPHEPTIAHVLELSGDDFWPADETEYAEAERVLAELGSKNADDDGEDDADDSNPGGLPIESNTPPAAIRKEGKRQSKPRATKAAD